MENAGIQRVVRGGLRDRNDDVAPVAPEITHGLVRQECVIPENDEAEIDARGRLDVDVVSIDHSGSGTRSADFATPTRRELQLLQSGIASQPRKET